MTVNSGAKGSMSHVDVQELRVLNVRPWLNNCRCPADNLYCKKGKCRYCGRAHVVSTANFLTAWLTDMYDHVASSIWGLRWGLHYAWLESTWLLTSEPI